MTDKKEVTALENTGISLDIVPYDSKDLELKGYMRLPKEAFEKLSMTLQPASAQLAQKM